MSDKEIQEIISQVLEALRSNSLTVDELLHINVLKGEDCVELNKGRKTSLDDIKLYLEQNEEQCIDVLTKDDDNLPTDLNVFSALRTLLEIANNNEVFKKIFLRKDQPEQTEYLLRLLGGALVEGGLTADSIDAEFIRVLETLSAKLVDALQVSATNVDAVDTISGKNVLASEKVAGQNVEAVDTVTGNYVEAKETVKGKNAAISGKTTTLNLLVQQLADMYDLNVSHVATLMRTIVKDYISSETFVPGFTGEGMKLYKALNGDWNLEVDNALIRKTMTIFELIISKIRAVNGGLVISPASGKVKSVSSTTGTPSYYVLSIEGDMEFVANDLVRCQVFTGTCIKYYWVPVASVNKDTILILKSDFPAGVVPAEGDDLVQMGNTTNTARQGLLYLTAAEDGKPRISVLDGVNSTSLVGKNKVILGCLDGMTDTDFPTDAQPSGYGLYAMNVFLKGIFILRNGKTIESELTTTNAAAKAAKDIADAAKSLATSANSLLADIASDNKLTPLEKQATKKEWDQIVSEKVKNDASATKYGVLRTAYNSAYSTLFTYITPLLDNLAVTSDIVGTTFRSTFKAYYDARTDLLNAISAKAKDLADAAQTKANKAETDASNAQKAASDAAIAAGTAQTTANNAVASADGATALLSDIANDNKLTAQEKQSTKKEWDVIVSEKVKNDASADKYGISKTAYTSAYSALATYITPLLANLTVTSNIVGSDFRTKFKGYYDARTDLLNAISAKSKDLADAAQGKANTAATAAANAQRDATAAGSAASSAQTTANNAATSAAAANSLLTDMASDNKLTATEKQATKKEWDMIVSEKPLNNASAAKFGVATTTYDTAYNALNTYITPLLASLSVTSDIVGTTFRTTFKAYYDARTNLLNAVSSAAKTLADNAQKKANEASTAAGTAQTKANEAAGAAGAAQTTANNAVISANGANALLADIANDNKLTPSEKQSTRKEWDAIASEKPLNDASADKFAVSKAAYGTAYTALNNYIVPLLTPLSTTSNIVGTTFRATFKAYYDARTNLLNSISAAAKTLADAAQKKANEAQKAADDLGTQLTTIETKFEIREGVISAKVTEVTTKATQAATSATNAKTSETNASGSATTAGQKATAASGSATAAAGSAANAKKAADDAAIVLKDVTLKESSITQTAGQIATKVTEVNTKVTEANTAATNAKKSETAASGSAGTAGAKAGEAATSASNAKGSADSAAAKLTIITEKESSITQTAGQIATKVTEVTKKATEASTSATNAKTSETNAGTKATQAGSSATAAAGSATTAGTKAADAKKAADDAAAKLVVITQKESSINQTAGSITLQVTEVTTKAGQAAASASAAAGSAGTATAKANAAADSAIIASAMSNGKMLYRDPSFKTGSNKVNVYNNLSNGVVTTTRIAAITGCPNTSGYCVKVNSTAAASPGWGGFYFGTATRANAIFVVRIIANIPVGRNLEWESNVTGTGGSSRWLTSRAGTGKWEEYAYLLKSGSSGTFSSTAFFYLTGGTTPTATAPLTWHLAYATVFDTTDAEIDYIADAAGKYTTKTEHSSSITQLSNSIALKVAKTDFDALGRRVGSAETTITQHTNQISLKAAQTDVTALGTRVASAEAKITPDAIKLTVKSQTDAIAAAAARRTTVLVDATVLDASKYYPVTILMNPVNPYTITVQRSLDAGMGKPSWSSHTGGFSVLCSWTSNGCVWDTIPVQRTIHTYTFAHSTVTPVGSIGQLTNSSLEYVYVRGGSKYHIVVDGTSSAAVILRTSTHTQSEQTVGILASVTAPVPAIKVASDAATAAQATANAANTAAGAAQTTATAANTSATAANSLLADIASDSKLTAQEKQSTKKEWDAIVSEKVKNDASADKFAVSKAAYGTAYVALNTYITPLLASLTTTSAIAGTDFRGNFKAYYDARTDLLNAISAKAKALADDAQAKANSAQTNLDNLQIGGRNLYKKSTPINDLSNAPAVQREESADSTNGFKITGKQNLVCSVRITNLIFQNGNYVVSFWGKSNSTSTPNFNMCDIACTGNAQFTTAWKKFELKVNVTNYTAAVYHFLDIENLGYLYYWFKDFKVEEGTKPTGWSPAPEDVDDKITSLETSFEIREGQISSKVTQATTSATTATTKAGEAAASAGTASTKATEAGTKATQAAGSATTAGTKAGEAATSASNAKKAADDAAAKLVTITQKETAINQTASNISLKATEVTTKATQAATSATTAGQKATAAAGSAATAGTKAGEAESSAGTAGTKANAAAGSATAAANSASSAAASLSSVTTKQSEINVKADQITLQVSTVTTKTAEAINAAELASAMSNGKMLYRDPSFKNGLNGVAPYNNLSNGVVTTTRIAAITGCPNTSGYCVKVNSTAAASPGWGGFYFGTATRANAIFVVRIIANIPVGRNLEWESNATGTGGSSRWLTPTAGTGKWEEYAYKLTCGSSGTFSYTAYFYLTGGATPTAAAPLTWYLAYATVFDTTDVDDVPTVDEIKAGIGVTAGKISIFGKDISLAGAVTFTSLDSTTQGKITTAQTTADTAKTAAVTAQTTANSAVANANTANTLLADIASDSKLTASEKQQIKKEWDAIVSEKVKNDASASKFSVSTAACTTAYNALNTYITPLLASLTTTSAIVGTTFRANFKAYYDARTDLLNAISAKAKDLADAAQVKANKAETDASNALINSRNNIAAKLGYASYADMEAKAAAGQTIITGGKIRTNLIEAEAIVTNALVAKAINAATITTGKLNVTDGAKIGGWSVTGNDLTCNGAGTAKLKIEVNGNKFLRINDIGDALLSIRHDSGDCIRLQTYSVGAVGMSITANSGGAYAIKSAGAHQFMQRAGEKWNAPGVLWCGRYNSWNANGTPYLITSWGDGLGRTPTISRYGYGKFAINHNLGHQQYYFIATGYIQRADGGQFWQSNANYGSVGDNFLHIEFKNDGGSEQCPGEFQVMIFGRNRW